MSTTIRRLRRRAAGAALGATAGLLALAGTAAAAPAAGTNLLVNGNFHSPAPGSTGAAPTGWQQTDLGVENDPYNASINAYGPGSAYAPPAGNPDPSNIADENFYEAGSVPSGVEGSGGEQTSATFGSITQADQAQVSFSDEEKSAPDSSVASWAGSGLEVDVISNGTTYSLIYLNPWTAYQSTFTSAPANTSTTHYILGPTLTAGTWYTQPARSLDTDISNQFGVTTFTVRDVIFVELENTTNGTSSSDYPNMTGYVSDLDLAEGGPAAATPEAPLAVALPVVGAAVGGLVVTRRRRRRA